jgi:hypothetical protein
MSIEDSWTLEVMAGFLKDFGIGALLGRRGFFENFTVKFDHSTSPPTLEVDRVARLN